MIQFRHSSEISNQAIVKLDSRKNKNIGIPNFLRNTNRKILTFNQVIGF